MEKSGCGEMNYKRKKPAYRKLRRTHGYVGLGKDQIEKEINKDHFNKILESMDSHYFNKKIN